MDKKVFREKSTFGFLVKRRMYLLQLSLTKPWLIPKCDKHYGVNKDIVLYGWLFIYFGYTDL